MTKEKKEIPRRADRIREMNDVELARFLCRISDNCGLCVANKYCYPGHTGFTEWLEKREEL